MDPNVSIGRAVQDQSLVPWFELFWILLETGKANMPVLCAWCQKTMDDSGNEATSHGLCLDCLPSVIEFSSESVKNLTKTQRNELPYGFVRLDHNNHIVEYNRAESKLARRAPKDVLGKNFFKDVAPCTSVMELAGWVDAARQRGESSETSLEFVFEFPFGKELVRLTLGYDASTGYVDIVVRGKSDSV